MRTTQANSALPPPPSAVTALARGGEGRAVPRRDYSLRLAFRNQTLRITIVSIAFVVFGTPSAALAVCPEVDYSVDAECARSVAVVVAKVVSPGKVTAIELADACWLTSYTLRIKESLRGSLPKTVEMFGGTSNGCFPLVKGKSYLLFLHDELGHLSVDNCGNSGPVPQKREMRRMRELTKACEAGRSPILAGTPPPSAVTALARGGDVALARAGIFAAVRSHGMHW